MLELQDIRLQGIGSKAGRPDMQWAELHARFTDTDVDHVSSVEVQFTVPRRPDVTIEEMEVAGRKAAVALLRALLDHLSSSSLAELEAVIDQRDQAEMEEHRQRMAEFE